jgi:glycerol-3-phosphate O-acyltransferase
VVFVPAALNFDRVLEYRVLVTEAARKDPNLEPPAQPKAGMLRRTMGVLFVGSLRLAIRGVRKFGYAAIRFGRPISLRAYMAAEGRGVLDPTREARAAPLKRLAERLMHEVGAVVPVPAVPLVALAVVHAGFSAGRPDIVTRVGHLRESLAKSGHRLVREDKTDAEIVDYALLLLVTRGTVVREADGLYRVPEGERAIVRYYANSIAHAVPEPEPSPAEEIG